MQELNLKNIISKFNKIAPLYQQHAALAQTVGQQMLNRLELVTLKPKTILDLGCGTGYFSEQLNQYYPKAQIISLDIAENMLQQAPLSTDSLLCADMHNLPLKTHSIDLIFTNLAFPWAQNIKLLLQELRRVCHPDGLLMFSTFGPDTLQELHDAWENQVTHYFDMHTLGDALNELQWSDPVMDTEYFTVTYSSFEKLLAELKLTGMFIPGQQKGLQTPRKLARIKNNYAGFKLDENTWPVTYEIVYGHAWGPKSIDTASEVRIPVSTLKVYKKGI